MVRHIPGQVDRLFTLGWCGRDDWTLRHLAGKKKGLKLMTLLVETGLVVADWVSGGVLANTIKYVVYSKLASRLHPMSWIQE